MAQYKKTGRKRTLQDAPETIPCSSCESDVQIDGVKHRRYKWLKGQSRFFCSTRCSADGKIGVPAPHTKKTMTGNKYALNRAPANKGEIANPRFFEVIDCEAKAYFLGLVAADGCVKSDSKNGYFLALALCDEKPIHQLKSLLGSQAKITLIDYSYTVTPQHSIKIGDKSLVEDLISHGITPRKTNTLEFPKSVPRHLIRHFIRGYMDGDGDVGFKEGKKLTVSFYGTKSLVDGCVSYLAKNLELKSDSTYQEGALTRFKRSQLQAAKILDHLYNSCNYFFPRKRQKYSNWLKSRYSHAV